RCREVYDALRADVAHPPPATLRADGGAAKNDVLLQLQADALGLPVERPAVLEAGPLGPPYLAGLAPGVWTGADELRPFWPPRRTPRSPTARRRMRSRWTTRTRADPSTWARPSSPRRSPRPSWAARAASGCCGPRWRATTSPPASRWRSARRHTTGAVST